MSQKAAAKLWQELPQILTGFIKKIHYSKLFADHLTTAGCQFSIVLPQLVIA